MHPLKQRIINDIIAAEGGYIDDPNDSGGETNFGITATVARVSGYYGDMREMPRDFAFTVYCSRYWDSLNADSLPEAVAAEVVDAGVNMGVSCAAKFLQRSLNVFNKQCALYNDIIVDGDIGPGTLSALDAFLEFRDELTLIKALNCLQGAFYIELAERREKDESFVYGWLKNRVKV
jgi:lysozyme family protein